MANNEKLVLDIKSSSNEKFWAYVIRQTSADDRLIPSPHNTHAFRANHLWIAAELAGAGGSSSRREFKYTTSNERSVNNTFWVPVDPPLGTDIVITELLADRIEIGSSVAETSLETGEFRVSLDQVYDRRLTIPRPLGNITLYIASQVPEAALV